MKNILEAINLSCEKGEKILFNKVNLRLESHQILLVIGQNGSGKTSLLRQLCGLSYLGQGDIRWNSHSVQENKTNYFKELVYIGHQHGIKTHLTAMENLVLDMALRGKINNLLVEQAIQKVGLIQQKKLLARFLSSGQARRLALARLVIFKVPIWILDEPLIGLDASALSLFEELLLEHTGRGGMVIMTSHQPLTLDNLQVKRFSL